MSHLFSTISFYKMLAIIHYFSLTNTGVLAEEEREEKELPPKPDFRRILKEGFGVLEKGSEKKLSYSKNNIKNKLFQIIVIGSFTYFTEIKQYSQLPNSVL